MGYNADYMKRLESALAAEKSRTPASERARWKPAGPATVVAAVAGGWVSASSAKFLDGIWRGKARDAEEKAENWRGIVDVLGDGGDYYRGVAAGYREAIQDLRAEMALQKRRQPAPNVGDVARPGDGATPKEKTL